MCTRHRKCRLTYSIFAILILFIIVSPQLVFADQLADLVANCNSNDDSKFDQGKINKELESKLYQLFSFRNDIPQNASYQDDRIACNWFVGQALVDFWGRHEFFFSPAGRYMTTYEIASLPDAKWDGLGWNLLGTADSQDTLTSAEAAAAGGKAVIAVNNGHIALILPGGLISSGWNLNVPRAAQLSIDHLQYAFVGCKLSLSFKKDVIATVKILSTK
jgi:hypothetical protein